MGATTIRESWAGVDPDGHPRELSLSARVGTPFGPAGVRWTRGREEVQVEIVVPGNTRGVLRLPGREDLSPEPGSHTITVRSP
ncbi:alpha-L-rhamnosidase C-terminal domain-containing protein [Streptomyces sp. NPDC005820]|uniref:alpha-L-rhamnosidase C-terminal domain-containing protein n=1 Tax=Streptomyces sp. NPDC005820 TaxID=3157069 RepID=UPI0033D6F1F8